MIRAALGDRWVQHQFSVRDGDELKPRSLAPICLQPPAQCRAQNAHRGSVGISNPDAVVEAINNIVIYGEAGGSI